MNIETELVQAKQYLEQNRLGQAKLIYREILRFAPDNPEANLGLGRITLNEGAARSAAEMFERAAMAKPADEHIRRNLAEAYLRSGQFNRATAEFRRLLDRHPDSADLWQGLGRALRLANNPEQAEQAYRKALEYEPASKSCVLDLSTMLILAHRYLETIELLEPAFALFPEEPGILLNLATAYERVSRGSEAEDLATRLLERFPTSGPAALIKARQEARRGDIDAGIERLEQVVARNMFAREPWRPLFDLAKLLDRKGDYGRAFKTFEQANKGQSAPYSREQAIDLREKVSNYRQWFTAERVTSWGLPPPDDLQPPVFFVGFPRSGTTLLEVISGAHPGILTTREAPVLSMATKPFSERYGSLDNPEALDSLTGEELSEARQLYMDHAAAVTGTDLKGKLLLDKLPLNLNKLPVISRIFPDAKLLVALRDPRDVALSCLMQSFGINKAMLNFTDLKLTGAFYSAVMGFWLSARPAIPMRWMKYRYEDLVANLEMTVREILDFIEIEWNDEVMNYRRHARQRDIDTPSFEGAAQSISDKAIGRWRNYRRELSPILPMLEPFVKEFGYDPD